MQVDLFQGEAIIFILINQKYLLHTFTSVYIQTFFLLPIRWWIVEVFCGRF